MTNTLNGGQNYFSILVLLSRQLTNGKDSFKVLIGTDPNTNESSLNMTKLTIKDIASKSGISRSTVSRVLSDNPNVNDETRARVLSVIKDL
ncbi:LacI family DNA-binding transcriptional regulator, partial [bacterium]|nr:LacI family DNA-binding transcriptional regulator [bacterium]